MFFYFFRYRLLCLCYFCQGLDSSQKADVMIGHLQSIIGLLQRIANDSDKTDELLKAAVTLLGDIAQVYGKRALNFLVLPFATQMLQEGLGCDDVVESANWAHKVSSGVALLCVCLTMYLLLACCYCSFLVSV
jgi:hypothetical protein